MYDTPDPDIKKSRTRVYLEKWRKVEPPFLWMTLRCLQKSEHKVNGMASTVQILSIDIGIQKCGVPVMKRGRVVPSEGVKVPEGERIKEVEENG